MFKPYVDRKARIPANGHLCLRFRALTSLPRDDANLLMRANLPSHDAVYPMLLRYYPDKEEAPKSEDLAWFEAVLPALAQFVTTKLISDEEGDFVDCAASFPIATTIGGKATKMVHIRYPGGEIPKSQTLMVDMMKTMEETMKNSQGSMKPGCVVHQDFYRAMHDAQEKESELREKATEECCANCGKRSEANMRCAACHAVMYCGRECQKFDWSIHKKECKRLKEEREKKLAAPPPTQSSSASSASSSHGHSHSHDHGHSHSHGHGHGHSHGHAHDARPMYGPPEAIEVTEEEMELMKEIAEIRAQNQKEKQKDSHSHSHDGSPCDGHNHNHDHNHDH